MPTATRTATTTSTPVVLNRRYIAPAPAVMTSAPSAPSGPRRSPARLPPELIDIIIDYLHADKDTLLNFALVSRRWLRSTRYHLFHHIRVLASDAHDASRAFVPFVLFLESHPHVGQFIRSVELCGSEAGSRGGRGAGTQTRCSDGFGVLDGDQLIPILRRLPFLHTLILSQVYLIAPSATGSWTEFTMPLRKLVMNEIYSDCEGAQWLVTVFKLYDTLHILDPIPVPSKPSPAIMNMPVDSFNLLENLKSLVIESRNDPMSLGKVVGLLPFIMKKLNTLELLLELEGRQHVSHLEAFIRSKGVQVKHLRLDIGDVEIFHKQPGVNITAVCPQLQSLHLCLFSSLPSELTADHWGYGTSVIAHGPRSVRRVTLGMITNENPLAMDLSVDWRALEEALLGLKDLEYVKFQAEGFRDGWRTTSECALPLEEEWRDYLQQHLPALRSRGLLRFRV